MFIYHLSDSKGWYDSYICRTKAEAIEKAERLMSRPAWEMTDSMTIHRLDTKTKHVDDVAITIHGANRSETHNL